MTPEERAFARVEADLARRSARRIIQFLERPDLSPACRELAREQRDEFLREAHMIDASLAIDAAEGGKVGVIFAFGSPMRYLKHREAL